MKRILKNIHAIFFRKLVAKDDLSFNPNKGKFLNVEIMPSTIMSGENEIGEYTYIGFNCSITKAKIGRYCSIANNVSIGIGEHRINRVSTSSLFYKNPFQTLTMKECIIGNDVWIGSNVVIRRGVKIGNGAIIGANSFVNKDVADFDIVAGTPAEIVRKRFDENTIKKIEKSNWWSFDFSTAKTIINELENQGNFEKND